MRIANFTELRKNLKGYLDSVVNNFETVVINREGGAGVVIMSLDEYNSLKETEYIMSSPETMRRIKAGAKSIADGRGARIRSVEDLNKFAEKL